MDMMDTRLGEPHLILVIPFIPSNCEVTGVFL